MRVAVQPCDASVQYYLRRMERAAGVHGDGLVEAFQDHLRQKRRPMHIRVLFGRNTHSLEMRLLPFSCGQTRCDA